MPRNSYVAFAIALLLIVSRVLRHVGVTDVVADILFFLGVLGIFGIAFSRLRAEGQKIHPAVWGLFVAALIGGASVFYMFSGKH